MFEGCRASGSLQVPWKTRGLVRTNLGERAAVLGSILREYFLS